MARNRKRKDTQGILLLVGALMFVAAVVGGVIFLLRKPHVEFEAHTDTYPPIVRRVGGPKADSPANLWNEENIQRYHLKGVGIAVQFVKELPNGQRVPRQFTLEAWKKYQEEMNNEARLKKVRAAQVQWKKDLDWLNEDQHIHRTVLAVVDHSGGVSAADGQLIKSQLELYKLGQSVQEGDKVTVRACLVSASRFPSCEVRSIEAKSSSGVRQLQDVTEGLSSQRPATPSTSLVDNIANVLIPLAQSGELPGEMFIFSDAIENSEGLSFYKSPKLLEKDQRESLFRLIESRKEYPRLEGMRIRLVGPRRGTGGERELIESSIAALADFFRHKGAHVETFYE